MPASKSAVLDVRPLIANGEEPFALIRGRVDALEAGENLTIIAPFLPSPLIEMLKGEGFQITMDHRADGGWSVNFGRD